jgi:hypothetical protein
VWGVRCAVKGLELRIQGHGFRVKGVKVRVLGFGFWARV